MSKIKSHGSKALIFGLLLALAPGLPAGCGGEEAGGSGGGGGGGKKHGDGEDEGGGGSKKKAGGKKVAAPAAGAPGQLKNYPKIKEEYRRELKERDFRPDPMGEENRDPFFSFVLEAPLVTQTAGPTTARDSCSDREWRGADTNVRTLQLMAIVLQGTRSWAQFRDADSMGHIVERGFCLGKEKAVVEHIGDNFVRLKITPEAPPGAATPEPVLEDFALFPSSMDLKETSE
jgi:hypothetical protein